MGFYWRKILQVIYAEQIDVLVVSNLLPGIPTAILKPPCKVVVDLKDLFSDNSTIYYNNPLAAALIQGTSESVLHLLLTQADHVITVSQYLMNYTHRIGVSNVSLIPNGADLAIFTPTITRDVNPELRAELSACPVIGFIGTIDRWIDFDTVLDALEQLLPTTPNARLLIVGGKMVTNYLDEVKASVQQRGLSEHVIFTGLVPHNHVPYYVNLMDVCLIPMRPELRLNQARCPDKLFEYLACGKPVVSTRLSEVIRIGGDTVAYYDDAASLTRQLHELLSNPTLQARLHQEALAIASQHDWAAVTQQFERVLLRVAARG
jgi:glycosyltransferase involved in cell wall biosynthesis